MRPATAALLIAYNATPGLPARGRLGVNAVAEFGQADADARALVERSQRVTEATFAEV